MLWTENGWKWELYEQKSAFGGKQRFGFDYCCEFIWFNLWMARLSSWFSIILFSSLDAPKKIYKKSFKYRSIYRIKLSLLNRRRVNLRKVSIMNWAWRRKWLWQLNLCWKEQNYLVNHIWNVPKIQNQIIAISHGIHYKSTIWYSSYHMSYIIWSISHGPYHMVHMVDIIKYGPEYGWYKNK